MRGRALSPVLLATAALAACGGAPGSPPAATTIRLVERFEPERVEGRALARSAGAHTELRFSEKAPAFSAGPGVADLAVREGRLGGRTTSADPRLRVSLPAAPAGGDLMHHIELRMRVSAGRNLALDLRKAAGAGEDPFAGVPILWPLSGPVIPDGQLHTYTVEPQLPIASDELAAILLAPCDAAGASFEVESLRVVFEKEFLASVPSGAGWRGLGEVYRETLVARAPEVLRIPVRVPEAPQLELAIGTIEDVPVRFRVSARASSGEVVLAERSVTVPQRWDPLRIDLADLAGQPIELALALASEHAGAIGFWGSPVVRSTSPRAGLQGVVVILADTLRPDHLDAAGYARETAPALRQMAREGTQFEAAFAQASWTKVSATSLLLSLYPSSHGIRSFADRLPEEAVTLAEAFRAAGFATFASSANFFVGKLTHDDQGFEEFRESGSFASGAISKTAREQVDGLLPWLDAHRDVPFFVYLHVTDPHSPYRPARPYDTRFASAEEGARHEREQAELRKHIAHPLMRAFGMPIASELAAAGIDARRYFAQDRAWYDGSIRAMDAELARVFERLRELALDERTLVVFTSDHGEEFLEHGASFHGRSVYGEVTRIPLVFWAPGRVTAGRVVSEPVQSIDVMPTLLELASVTTGAALQGQSLAPLLAPAESGDRASAWRPRPAISEHRTDLSGPVWVDREATAIVDGDWKLIENANPGPGVPPLELYDAARDPLDQHDVAAAHADVVERLRAALTAWRAETAKIRLESAAPGDAALSPDEIERLKSLGYVQ